jgi:hypothetical protein
MPASVRIILKPLGIPGSATLEEVASARLSLVRNGGQSTLAGASAQPALLTFSFVPIEKIRSGAQSAPQPLATFGGVLLLQGGELEPSFNAAGIQPLPLVVPIAQADADAIGQRASIVIELDPQSFGESRSLTLPLPQLGPEVQTLEVRAELRLAGAIESPSELNDFFDFLLRRKVAIARVQVLSVSFASDHRALRDNAADLGPPGPALTKPEWTFATGSAAKPSLPVSHTKNVPLRMSIVVEVHPANAAQVECEVIGKADFGAELRSTSPTTLKGGTQTIAVTSLKPLQNEINKLVGNITWSVKVNERTLPAGTSVGHSIYLLFASPSQPSGREQGISIKRMDESVRLFRETGTLDPQTMVQTLRGKVFPSFTLDTDQNVDPAFQHPTFFNNVGGAWRILETASKEAHCQALVRVVDAMCKVIGMQGTFETLLAFCDPVTAAPLDEPMGLGVTGGLDRQPFKNQVKPFLPFLSSAAVDPKLVGKRFRLGDVGSPDLNVFEACMRFTDASGQQVVHPGGAGAVIFSNINEVVPGTFRALILVTLLFDPANPPLDRFAKLEKIVQVF